LAAVGSAVKWSVKESEWSRKAMSWKMFVLRKI